MKKSVAHLICDSASVSCPAAAYPSLNAHTPSARMCAEYAMGNENFTWSPASNHPPLSGSDASLPSFSTLLPR